MVAAALFLGGYKVPFNLGGDTIIGQFLQVGAFFTKTLLLYCGNLGSLDFTTSSSRSTDDHLLEVLNSNRLV